MKLENRNASQDGPWLFWGRKRTLSAAADKVMLFSMMTSKLEKTFNMKDEELGRCLNAAVEDESVDSAR
jgi:hypothetical protein